KYPLKSDNLELVTVIETTSADELTEIPPAFVFSGVHFCEDWLQNTNTILNSPAACLYCVVATTSNGWTSEDVCAQWHEKLFLPATQAQANLTVPTV
ncbi:hypothetical protein C8F01DRAFT_949010, partial [Mycena amicta]